MDVIEELRVFKRRDIPYERVLGSMCTVPHPIAVKAHIMFLETNLGDPGIFRGTRELEIKLIGLLGEILNNPKAVGYVCSGGTEANIQAIRSFRNLKDVKNPNIVVPKSAHFSFDKVGDLLRVEVRKADLDENYRVDPSSVESLIDDETVGLVGIAGTTELGQVDPIDELSEIALDYGIYLHVDAAFGGLVLPFLNPDIEFDFRLKGVSSITVDPHKMGMATIPSGGILFKNDGFLRALEVETPYLTSKTQWTLTGTRPGTGVASAYAVLKHLGFEGMKKIVENCMRITWMLVEEMEALGFERVIDPIMNIVCFKTEHAERIKEELERRGWIVSSIREPKALRIVVMPHVTESVVESFVEVLKNVMFDLLIRP